MIFILVIFLFSIVEYSWNLSEIHSETYDNV